MAGEIKSSAELRLIFKETYNSPPLAEKVLASYGVTAEISCYQRSNGIIDFLTDATFSYPIDCARNSLVSQQPTSRNLEGHSTPKVYQGTTVQSYRIKFGNPFPGPCHDVAQHCVELIYLFDAFHDHMTLVDNESSSSRGTPDEAPASNATLRETLQRHWISFIVDDQSDVSESQTAEPSITVYGKDGRATVESLVSGQEWVEQKERFKLLAADWKGALAALKTITGTVLM